jgi:hypothetical protein
MGSRYQNRGELEGLFCFFITFFCCSFALAWQEQFSCQTKKNFFAEKRLHLHMAIW